MSRGHQVTNVAYALATTTLLAIACGGTVEPTGTADAGTGDSAAADAGRVPQNHRADDAQCRQAAPRGDCAAMPNPGGCAHDVDCTMGQSGRCIRSPHGPGGCYCSYDQCQHDSDCGAGNACACHGSAFLTGENRCISSGCRVDADCGPTGFCSPARGDTGCGGVTGYYCHTAADECVDDTDCTSGKSTICTWSSTAKHWSCQRELICP